MIRNIQKLLNRNSRVLYCNNIKASNLFTGLSRARKKYEGQMVHGRGGGKDIVNTFNNRYIYREIWGFETYILFHMHIKTFDRSKLESILNTNKSFNLHHAGLLVFIIAYNLN